MPKQHNPLTFQWQGQPFEIPCMLLGDMGDGQAISVLVDVGETVRKGCCELPIYTYCNFVRQQGLTVNQSLSMWS